MRWWCSWICREPDHRPVTFPPNESILGWWHTGYDSSNNATLVALVEAPEPDAVAAAIGQDWPDWDRVWRIEPDQVAEDWRPGSRFPLSEWMEARVG